MAFIITHGDLSFLLYLAVAEGSRGMGYGTRALDEVKRMSADRRLFLNIEPLDEDSDNMAQRMSRKRFYERNGFSSTSATGSGRASSSSPPRG